MLRSRLGVSGQKQEWSGLVRIAKDGSEAWQKCHVTQPHDEAVLYPPHIPSRTKWNGRNPSKFQPIPSKKIKFSFFAIPTHSESFQVIPSGIQAYSNLNFFNKITHLAIPSHSKSFQANSKSILTCGCGPLWCMAVTSLNLLPFLFV